MKALHFPRLALKFSYGRQACTDLTKGEEIHVESHRKGRFKRQEISERRGPETTESHLRVAQASRPRCGRDTAGQERPRDGREIETQPRVQTELRDSGPNNMRMTDAEEKEEIRRRLGVRRRRMRRKRRRAIGEAKDMMKTGG